MKTFVGVLVFAVVLFPSVALGQTVTILGLQSATADEQVAATVTEAIRDLASQAGSSELTHTGRENQLSQLLVVFDCEEATPRCMREIGESLESQRLIYGVIEPESGRSDSRYTVTIRFFNVESGEIEREVHEAVPRNVTAESVGDQALAFFNSLVGAAYGDLSVRCNVAGAVVLLGDREVGRTSNQPLVIHDLDPGEVSLEVSHDEYLSFRRTITIAAGQTQDVMVQLAQSTNDPDPDIIDPDPEVPSVSQERGNLAWLGYTLIGTAVVFGGLGLWSSLNNNSINNSDIFEEQHLLYWTDQGPEANFCDLAAQNQRHPETSADVSTEDIVDLCDRGSAHQVLQFIFYGLSVATAAVGIWLLIREIRRQNEAETADDDLVGSLRLTIDPVVFEGGGVMALSLHY